MSQRSGGVIFSTMGMTSVGPEMSNVFEKIYDITVFMVKIATYFMNNKSTKVKENGCSVLSVGTIVR